MRKVSYALASVALLSVGCGQSPTAPSETQYSPLMGSVPGGRFSAYSLADDKPTDNPLNSCNNGAPVGFNANVHRDAQDNGKVSVDFVSKPIANADQYDLEVFRRNTGRVYADHINGKPQTTIAFAPGTYDARLRRSAESGNCGTPGAWTSLVTFSIPGGEGPAQAYTNPEQPYTQVG
jgi:hypothetical protein